jgi:hypothetical protein
MSTKSRLLLPLIVIVPGIGVGLYGVLSSSFLHVLPKTFLTSPSMVVGWASVLGCCAWGFWRGHRKQALLNSALSEGGADLPRLKHIEESWGIAIDEERQVAVFADWHHGEPRRRCFRLGEIRDVRLELNKFERIEESRRPGLGGMVVGMQMYGLLGAIAGGWLTSKKKKEKVNAAQSVRLVVRTGAEPHGVFSGVFHLYNKPVEELYRICNFDSALSIFVALSFRAVVSKVPPGEEDKDRRVLHTEIGPDRHFLLTDIGQPGHDGKFTIFIPKGALLPSEHSMLVSPDQEGKIRCDYYQCRESPRKLLSCEVTGVAGNTSPVELIIQIHVDGRVAVYAKSLDATQRVVVNTTPVQGDLPYAHNARRWRPFQYK